MSKLKALKWVSYLCLLAGFAVPFVVSRYVGMSLYQRPRITILNGALWAVGLIIAYCAYLVEKKLPAGTPTWMRISSFLTSTPATIVFLGFLWGYTYYPTMEKSVFAQYVNVPLMISLFVCGIQISKSNWVGILKRPRVVGLSVVVRWVVPTVCAYLLGHFILVRYLPQPAGNLVAIGMIILATTPTGPAGNTMTLISRGDLALSVSATAVNNVIAPFLQPFLIVFFAGKFIGKVNAHAIFMELIQLVLAPVILGSLVGALFPEQVKKFRTALAAIAVVCLSFIMLANISKGTATLLKTLWILPWMLGAGAVQAVCVLSAGYYLPKYMGFTVKQRVATCFDVAVENASLATVIAMAHFGPLAALPAIFYGKLQHMFGIGIFVRKFQGMPELAEEQQRTGAAKAASAAQRT